MLVYQRVDAKKPSDFPVNFEPLRTRHLGSHGLGRMCCPRPIRCWWWTARHMCLPVQPHSCWLMTSDKKYIIVGKPRQIPHPCSWNPHSCFGKLRIFCGKHQSFYWSNNHLWCLNHFQQFDPWAGESQPRAREADGRQDRQGSLLIRCLLAFAMFDSLRPLKSDSLLLKWYPPPFKQPM